MPSRSELEAIAGQTLALYETALSEGNREHLRDPANKAAYGELVEKLGALGGALRTAGLFERDTAKKAWLFHPDKVGAAKEADLTAVAEGSADFVRAAGSDKIAFALDEGGRQELVAAVGATARVLNANGMSVPSTPVADAVEAAAAEPVAESAVENGPRTVVMVTDARLYDVTQSSLDLLEAIHSTKPDFTTDPLRAEFSDRVEKLQDALEAANYMVPGTVTARKTPYREQSQRGGRAQNEAILEAARQVAQIVVERGALDGIQLTGNDGGLARAGLTAKARGLNGSVALAFPEEIAVADEAAAEPVAPLRNPMTLEGAVALSKVFDAAAKITGEGGAQVDTILDQNEAGPEIRVSFKASQLKSLNKALGVLDETDAEMVLRDAAEGLDQIPGLSAASAESLAMGIEKLRDLSLWVDVVSDQVGTTRASGPIGKDDAETAEEDLVDTVTKGDAADRWLAETSRSVFDDLDDLRPTAGDIDQLKGSARISVPASVLDHYIQVENEIGGSGALAAVYGMAGRDDVPGVAVGVPDAVTLNKIIGVSRPPNLENMEIRGFANALPEMSAAHFANLHKDARDKAGTHVFTLRPGEDWFDGYQIGAGSLQTKEKGWQQIALRNYIRSRLMTEGDKPDAKFRSFLMNLRSKTIVAPTEWQAVVLREESERTYELQRRQQVEKRDDYLSKADAKNLDLDPKEVRRFLDVLESSGSEAFPTLLKKDGALVIEHPEAPTLFPTVDKMGNLEKQKNGYLLAKIDPAELRAAYERGLPKIRIDVRDDRPLSIDGFDPDKNGKGRRRASKGDEQSGS